MATGLVEQPQRANRETFICSRTGVVGIFPDSDAIIRLVGAVLAEKQNEWAESRRYLGLDALAKSQAAGTTKHYEETTPNLALSA